jgi:glycosyltransferase involved in cell wall biosynthesis
VTILFTLGSYCENGVTQDWVESFGAEGINFQPLPNDLGPQAVVGAKTQHETYIWCKQQSFDVIHFPEWQGTGFFLTQAKRLGIAFTQTTLCVGVHSPTMWHDLENHRRVDDIDQLSIDALERGSVAFADVAVCPSQYLLGWLKEWGWPLPAESYVWPNVSPVEERPAPKDVRAAKEIVFFGRLESCKGLELFCAALRQLVQRQELAADITVTFLGKAGLVAGADSLSYLQQQAAQWPFSWQVLTGKSQGEAIEYLTAGPRLAVMPSLADNTPNVVHECIGLQVPFVTTTVGGIPEMIAVADHEETLAAPQPAALAQRIAWAVNNGIKVASPAVDLQTVRDTWVAWHEGRVGLQPSQPAVTQTGQPEPLVSVCLATRNRADMLRQALASLQQQSYPLFEVIVVDDGSDEEESIKALEELEPELVERGWRLLREPQSYPGAARNTAAKHARGEYLLFMDDDNLALPEEIETFVQAARWSQIPILTCAMDAFADQEGSSQTMQIVHRWLPIGTALPLGALTNCFGDTNMFVCREVFFAVGAFPEEPGAGLVEDWIFFSRAALKGVEIAVVPEALFLYRLGAHGFGQSRPAHLNYLRSLRPYLEALPPELSLGLVFAAGAKQKPEADRQRLIELEGDRQRLIELEGDRQRLIELESDLQRLNKIEGIYETILAQGPQVSPVRSEQPLLQRLVELAGLAMTTVLAPQSTTVNDQRLLKERFAQADELLCLDLDADEVLRPTNQLSVEQTSEGLLLRCAAGDPHGRLCRFDHRSARTLLVRLDITSPHVTLLQLFWKTWMFPLYCEGQSASTWLGSGTNEVYLQVPARHLVGTLRLDPAAAPGDYLLSRFEVRQEC